METHGIGFNCFTLQAWVHLSFALCRIFIVAGYLGGRDVIHHAVCLCCGPDYQGVFSPAVLSGVLLALVLMLTRSRRMDSSLKEWKGRHVNTHFHSRGRAAPTLKDHLQDSASVLTTSGRRSTYQVCCLKITLKKAAIYHL